jgi:alkylhydroperoxidase/carboxymuconolactone decarboxylase family protein YurZ
MHNSLTKTLETMINHIRNLSNIVVNHSAENEASRERMDMFASMFADVYTRLNKLEKRKSPPVASVTKFGNCTLESM